MPYFGRPSAGCHCCRKRKIRCDGAEPNCGNCVKARWTCPGYRDALDLLFHDESSKVARKVQIAKEKAGNKRPETGAATVQRHGYRKPCKQTKERQVALHGQENWTNPAPAAAFSQPSLPPDLDELAIGFFYHYYLIDVAGSQDGWLAMKSNSCLLASITALGAVGVTKLSSWPSCSAEVHYRYQNAIQLTNQALCSEEEIRKDSTLLAVNLLSIYETVTGCQKSLKPWHDHVRGAAALLQCRGIQQFETAEGGRLFMQTFSLLATSCLQLRLPIPTHIHRLTTLASDQVPHAEDQYWKAFVLTLRFVDLHARLLPNNLLRSPDEAESVIEEALKLDRDMLALLDDVSEDWYYETVLADGPTVFDGRMHIYPSAFTAQRFNELRYRRIVVHDIVLKAIRSHPDPSSLQFGALALQRVRNSTRIVRELQLDILASVPQHIDDMFLRREAVSQLVKPYSADRPKDAFWTNFAHGDLNPWRFRKKQSPSLPPVRTNCGYTIHWPLYVAGTADAMDGEVRIWARDTLRSIGHTMGVQQALLLADCLETGEGEQLNAHLEYSTDPMQLASSYAMKQHWQTDIVLNRVTWQGLCGDMMENRFKPMQN